MNPTAEQIAKLPKWARDHINVLANRVQDLEARSNDGDYQPRWAGDDPRVFLVNSVGSKMVSRAIAGTYGRILFYGDDDTCIEITATVEGARKVVQATARDLRIAPRAANTAIIEGRSDTW